MDELIYFGGAVKALGDGKVGGYLIEFTDFEQKKGTPPDLTKEFFTKSTDYDIEDGERKTAYFDHGQDPVLKRKKLAKVELKTDDVGVWAEGILDTRDKYLAKIYEMAEAGKLGWSSGSAPHLTSKKKNAEGFSEIVSWPIVEASLTHRPCNPFSQAIPLKSYIEIDAPDIDGKAHTKPAKSIKGLFNDKLTEQTPTSWQLESAYRDVLRDIAQAADSQDITGITVDIESKVREATAEYLTALSNLAVSQINDYLEGDTREPFYLKSILDELIASGDALVSDASLEGHSQAVVSAVAEFAQKGKAASEPLKTWLARLQQKQEFRANDPLKAGRVISQANRDRIAEVMGMIKELMPVLEGMHGSLSDLHSMAEPKQGKSVDPDVLRGLIASFEMARPKRTLRR